MTLGSSDGESHRRNPGAFAFIGLCIFGRFDGAYLYADYGSFGCYEE